MIEPILDDNVTEEIQHRELTDNDYELLLQLDRYCQLTIV